MSRFLTKIINQQPGEGKRQQEDSTQDRLSTVDTPPVTDRVSVVDSLSKRPPTGYPMDRLSTTDTLSTADSLSIPDSPPTTNLLSKLPETAGRLGLPHRYTDHLCQALSPDEQAVYVQLYRLSWGWDKDSCFISNPRLSERSNVPLTTMRRVVKALIAKGLVEITDRRFGSNQEQGITYRVSKLDSPSTAGRLSTTDRLSTVAPIIIKHTKQHTHTGAAPSDEQKGRATRGVGVGSRFSVEECRRYAEHLRSTGQGINNPGGYATTIHRTGEVDQLIEGFLKLSSDTSSVDFSNCLDCQGTGFYYPKGKEHGVAKCPHASLQS
jgi:hypothetical protein